MPPAILPLLTALYTTTALTSAFLLFLVQPMFARMTLPYLGGAPAVWNTAMVFYQVVLLLGYAWTHFSLRWLPLRVQASLQVLVMALALVVLPVAMNPALAPGDEGSPVLWLLGVYALSIGLPFFAVSTVAPLLQRWISRTDHPHAGDPYFLYAASNVGSIAALLAYPFVIEPRVGLVDQGRGWSLLYVVLVGLIVACAVALLRRRAAAAAQEEPLPDTPVGWPRRLRWMFLAAVPSSLLLSVTSHLTTDIASVPFLWVLPLTLFLLTFVIVFARRRVLPHVLMLRLQTYFLLIAAFALFSPLLGLGASLALHLGGFFVCAMVCHGALADTRPAPSRLTEFYLYMSIGGALGGALTAIGAPLVFDGVYEYPIGILLSCLARPGGLARSTARARGLDLLLPIAVTLFAVAALRATGEAVDSSAETLIALALAGALALAVFSFSERPLRLALGAGGLMLYALAMLAGGSTVLERYRGFYGVLKVERGGERALYRLKHGTTVHGIQIDEPGRRTEPTLYYHRNGPAGQTFRALGEAGRLDDVGLVGLGLGTLTCYRGEGQRWRIFEIDPLVVAVANDTRYFHYMDRCARDIPIVLRDARLSLADEPDGRYDLLVVDAFSSDSIPVHLVTREALDLYLAKLSTRGVLLLHVSNRHLDLKAVVARLVESAGLVALRQRHPGGSDERDPGSELVDAPSQWIVIARSDAALEPMASSGPWVPLPPAAGTDLWTDDFSNLYQLLVRD